METLHQFYSNERMREEVHNFLVQSLGERAQELSFEGRSTEGIKDARIAIDNGFARLKSLYSPKGEISKNNQSR